MTEDPKEVDRQWYVDTFRALTSQVEPAAPQRELVEAVLDRNVEAVIDQVISR